MLSLVSTPIGNLKDITLRAIETLKNADVILAEDTRHTGLLLKHLEIPHKPLISLYDEIEEQKINEILKLQASAEGGLVQDDTRIALVSDAGTPLISDPGYKLVREAIKMGIKVESIPGPCAAISALTISGLPPDKFLFLGYPPEKKSHIIQLLNSLNNISFSATMIFYISPHKLLRFLGLLNCDQEIVICRELTKIYEEVWKGSVSQALIKFAKVKGEIVILWHT